ncbi:MAG: MFS transporter [Anaerolineales bacterium]|nr:MFS transporter [Anaerolineales bacterium]
MIKKNDTYKIYLFIEVMSSLLYSMAFTTMSLYEVTVARLTPLQLVLVGTTLEVTVMLFEIPTGVVADVYSRRLSVIIGFFLIGTGFLVEGLFPVFLAILLAQVLWGVGYTFTSGAMQAWISDEIGEERANKAFLRANQAGLAGGLGGMVIAILIGSSTSINIPILLSGLLRIFMGVVLVFIMVEHHFKSVPREDRSGYDRILDTFKKGLSSVRSRPRLLTILGVGLFYGLYSEGFDRLWVKHLLDDFNLPVLFGHNEVAFFGMLKAAGMLLSIAATNIVEKHLDMSQPKAIGRAMIMVTTLIAAALIGYAISPLLGLTLGIYLLIDTMRTVAGPLYTAWVNQKLDSSTRATVLSMSSQVDAIGQIGGGPIVGMIASLVSVKVAIIVSGLLLTPALVLSAKANHEVVRRENST